MSRLSVMRLLMVIQLAFVLSGCTAIRLTYNNIDLVVRYMASDYVELEPSQREDFRSRFSRLHAWHRRDELPIYASLMTEAARRLGRGLEAADVIWATGEWRSRFRVLVTRAAVEAAPILLSLDPSQISEVERKLEEANAKYARERHLADPNKRVEHSVRQLKKNFEQWMDSLSKDQEERIVAFVREFDFLMPQRFEDRRRRQREGMHLLRNERNAATLARRMAELFAQPEIGRSPGLAAQLVRYDSGLATLVEDIYRDSTSEQRHYALNRLHSFSRDFASLASQNPSVQ